MAFFGILRAEGMVIGGFLLDYKPTDLGQWVGDFGCFKAKQNTLLLFGTSYQALDFGQMMAEFGYYAALSKMRESLNIPTPSPFHGG